MTSKAISRLSCCILIPLAFLLIIYDHTGAQTVFDSAQSNMTIQTGTPDSGNIVKKWNPGHYMQVIRGDYESIQENRFKMYDQIADEDAIVGVAVPFRWSQLEGDIHGDYRAGRALVNAELAKLKSLKKPKRMIIKIIDIAWTFNDKPRLDYWPKYIQNSPYLVQTNENVKLKNWLSKPIDWLIELNEAYSYLDDDPFFEGIVYTREIVPGQKPVPDDFNATAYENNYKRLAAAVKAAFPKSNVWDPNNWMVSQAVTDRYMHYLADIGVGFGQPDTAPNPTIFSDRTLRGLSGGKDLRGIMPVLGSVESTSFDIWWNLTAKEVYDIQNNLNKASHMAWDRNTFKGTSEQRWETGILPVIRANPLTHTQCPAVYNNTCITGGTTTPTPAAPTATLSAVPASITAGQSATLTWTSTNATSCTGTGFSTGGKTAGSISVSPAATTNYTLTCAGSGGSANKSVTLTVAPKPTTALSLTVTPLNASGAINASPVNFTWSKVSGATEYYLGVGTTASSVANTPWGNLFARNTGTAVTKSVSGIPLNGKPVYVRVWWKVNSVWKSKDFTLNTITQTSSATPELTSPAANSVVSASSVTFQWTPATGATEYYLGVGTTAASVANTPWGNIFAGSVGTATSKAVTKIPLDGKTIYVRLWWKVNNAWKSRDYTFPTSAPSALTPTTTLNASPASITAGQSTTLTWTSTNATSCTGTGFSTGNKTSSSAMVSPATNNTYTVTCTGSGGSVNKSVTVTVSEPLTTRSPFTTKPSLPGNIEAVAFDKIVVSNKEISGEGITYHDIDPGKTWNAHPRSLYAVPYPDVRTGFKSTPGTSIGNNAVGEWQEHTVDIPETVTVIPKLEVASMSAKDSALRLRLDGQIIATFDVPATGSWDTWTKVTAEPVTIEAGENQILRVEILNDGFDFSQISFEEAASIPDPQPGSFVKKWNPGHYMQILRGDYEAIQVNRFKMYDQITNETAITGVVVPLRWSQLEGSTQGDYSAGIALVRAEINKLKSLNAPKRIFLRVIDHAGTNATNKESYFPAYIVKAGYTHFAAENLRWRRWNETAMGYYINMLNAYAKAFDDEPYFEGLYLVRETANSWYGGEKPSDYSDLKYDQQLRRLAVDMSNSFKRSNVIMPLNYLNSDNMAINHVGYLRNLQVGLGGPDVLPSKPTQGQKIWMGILGGVDYRGVLPLIQSIESSELGGVLGSYTPTQLFSTANSELRVSHLFWDRNTFAGTTEQRWDTGILPFIRKNQLTHTQCPAVYNNTCVTGGTTPSPTTPTATLTAVPVSITAGQSTTLTWTSINATSCVGTGFSTSNKTAGSVSVSPTANTSYSLACTGTGGTVNKSVTINVSPKLSTTRSPFSTKPTLPADPVYSVHFDKITQNGVEVSGQNVTYSDVDPTNSGHTFRGAEITGPYPQFWSITGEPGVAWKVGSNKAGEWREYTVDVPKSVTVIPHIRVASLRGAEGNPAIQAKIDNITMNFTVPKTDSWNTWQTVTADPVTLPAGSAQVMRVTQMFSGADWHRIWFEVETASAPTATLTASPASITAGQSTTLTWSSTNATSCTGTGFTTGNKTAGSVSVSPSSTTRYTLNCTGTGSDVTTSATVNVTSINSTNLILNPAFSEGVDNWTLYASASAARFTVEGGKAKIAVSAANNNIQLYQAGMSLEANTRYRVSFDAYSSSGRDMRVLLHQQSLPYTNYGLTEHVDLTTTSKAYSYEFTTMGFSARTTDARLRFWFSDHAKASDVYWIDNVVLEKVGSSTVPPTATLSAAPTAITTGQSATLTWTSTNATSCNSAGFSTGNKTAGSVTVSPTATTSYSLSCTGSGGSANKSVTVNISSAPPPPNTSNEVLVYDWNGIVTKNDRGFPKQEPPINNTNWVSPENFVNGTVHTRMEIRSMPTTKDMRLQLGIWQTDDATDKSPNWSAHEYLESTTPMVSLTYSPGVVKTTQALKSSMWINRATVKGTDIDYTRPRFRTAMVVKKANGLPVSDFNGWNWNGENPDEWYPMDARYTVVFVKNGATFSGWGTYTGTPLPTATLNASPTSLTRGESVTLTWNSTNTTSCNGSNFSTRGRTVGSASLSPTATTTYTLACTGPGGEITKTTTVTVSAGTSSNLTFQKKTIASNAKMWWARSFADIDGDGYLDIVLQNHNDGHDVSRGGGPGWLGWLRNNRDTTFTLQPPIATRAPNGSEFASGDMATGDIDGDGDMDVLGFAHPGEWAKSGGNIGSPTTLYWYENKNNGTTWTAHEIGVFPDFVKEAELADFDNDGDLDLAVLSFDGEYTLSVYRQDAKDRWTRVLNVTNPKYHEGLAVGDIDGDGFLDLAYQGWWRANPGGNLTGSWNEYVIDAKWHSNDPNATHWSRNATKVFIKDITGDGKAEVFISNSERPGYPVVYYTSTNPRAGSWREVVIQPAGATVAAVHTLQVYDFDGDGDYDVLAGMNKDSTVINANEHWVRVYLNAGNNTTWNPITINTTGIYNGLAGDVNNDGKIDFMGLDGHTGTNLYLYLNTTGSAASKPLNKWTKIDVDTARTPNPEKSATATSSWFFGLGSLDLNSDGNKDIVSGAWTYRSPGGTLAANSWNKTQFPVSVDAGLTFDADGDGDIDILGFTLTQNTQAHLYINNNGTFTRQPVTFNPRLTATPHMNPQGYAVADIVPGGKKELVIEAGTYETGTAGIYVIEIPTTLTNAWNVTKINGSVPVGGNGLAVGDIDGDGYIDVFTGNKGDVANVPPKLYWFKNPGSLRTGWNATLVDTWPTIDRNVANGKADNSGDRFAIADLDGDGKNDLIVTEETYRIQSGNHVYWYKNNGNDSTFTRKTIHQGGASYNSLAVADFNNDGHLDVAFADMGLQANGSIYVAGNDGKGNFTIHTVASGLESHGMIADDFNNDGKIDLATIAWTNPSYKYLRVFRNDN